MNEKENCSHPELTEKELEKHRRMTEEPIPSLVVSLAIPTMISMLVTSLYNMVDTYFVAQLGTEATAGVGLVFPVMAIMQAFGFMLGQGSGNFISRALGGKDTERAETMASTGCIYALGIGALILLLGLVFNNGLLYILGARPDRVTEPVIYHAGAYLRFILLGAPFFVVSCVLNNQMRFQGNALFSMFGLMSGAVLNCALDPIFIFVLDLGSAGAALATVISQFVGCTVLYIGTLRSDSIKLRLRNFSPRLYYARWIIVGGLPSFFRQGLSSISTLALNTAAGLAVSLEMADEAIAAFSIVQRLMFFGFSLALGFAQGYQPICGFNYGAKRYDRVRQGYVFCLKSGFAMLTTLATLGFIFAPQLIGIFRDSEQVIAIGKMAMRLQCCVFPLVSMVSLTNIIYQNIGRVVEATLLSVARQGLFFIPAVLLLPRLLGTALNGVYLAQPLADLCAFLFALPLAVKIYKELKGQEKALAN